MSRSVRWLFAASSLSVRENPWPGLAAWMSPIARFRRVAIIRAPVPVRIRQRSSSYAISRIQCWLSICQ